MEAAPHESHTDSIPMDSRKIIHIDMDAFYASVALLDAPELRGKPLIIGGDPKSRGVVSSASYEARKFGIHSAMPCKRAKQLCPEAIFCRPDFPRYKAVSEQIQAIFYQYTDLVETLSLDEAWLDVTENFLEESSATHLAQKIKRRIHQEVGLTCSAGVSFNKFLAKIASDEKKPNGLFVIPPKNAQAFLLQMEVKKIPGVGKVTAKQLAEHNIHWGNQLHEKSVDFLVEHFGKFGQTLYERIRGIDLRPVVPFRETKSISVETTFTEDLLHSPALRREMAKLVGDLWEKYHKQALEGKTLTLKIKFADFSQITRSVSEPAGIDSQGQMEEIFEAKLQAVCEEEFPAKPIRLVGVGVSNFQKDSSSNGAQLDFFHLLEKFNGL